MPTIFSSLVWIVVTLLIVLIDGVGTLTGAYVGATGNTCFGC